MYSRAKLQQFFAVITRALIVVCLIGASSSRALADNGPIADPDMAAKETTALLADGQAEAAASAVFEKIRPPGAMPSRMILDEQNMKAGFKTITQNGKANFFDKSAEEDFGAAVKIIIYYLNYPKGTGDAANQFVFLRYTFMKIVGGWQMTDFTFATSASFPPAGWSLLNASK
jgi:hypothetical protein